MPRLGVILDVIRDTGCEESYTSQHGLLLASARTYLTLFTNNRRIAGNTVNAAHVTMPDTPQSGNLFDLTPSRGESGTDGARPLAERMRPADLAGFFGQRHLVGEQGALRPLLDAGRLHSMILWGDPGVGKTTLARLLAGHMDADFLQLSAVTSGVKDVRQVIDRAQTARRQNQRTVLFIDEIHRFNKAQQDALLHAVEEGVVTLIGATTENPSFEVIAPLLSRCRVYRFNPLSQQELSELLEHVHATDEEISTSGIELEPEAREALIALASGDARELLNLLERALERAQHLTRATVDLNLLETVAAQALSRYDKSGDKHYDTISAFIKSVRNSDPDAAVYYLARMIEAGEDPIFIARRLIILASEDIGNANPNALLLAQSGFDAVHKIGMPEGRIVLSQVTTYLAASEKSNAAYQAINEAQEEARKGNLPPIPMQIRNAPTKLMKAEGYGEGYEYAHSEEHGVAAMPCLPRELEGRKFYRPKNFGAEAKIKKRLEELERIREKIRAEREQKSSGEGGR